MELYPRRYHVSFILLNTYLCRMPSICIHNEAKILVEGLLVREPSNRLTVQAALEARWIVVNSKELLHDYNERIKNF